MNEIDAHPAANLFPMMPDDQYQAFKEDIRKNGFQQDVTFYKGQILDGRNRYKAAIELDLLDELPICEIDDDTNFDPYQWVISRNLHRRHLNESQRALVAAKLAKLRVGEVGNGRVEVQICTPTLRQAAEQLDVGRTTVAHAKTVLANGSQELIEAVERGEVAVSKAAAVAKEVPKECQLNYIIHEHKQKIQQDVEERAKSTLSPKIKNKGPERDLDAEAVQAFLTCRSRLSRIKKLLIELTETEIQVVSDWIKNSSK